MGDLYEGRECRIGLAMETTFKTRVVDGGTFTEIKADPGEVDPDVKVYEVPGASGGKSPLHDHRFTNTSGSMPRLTIAGPMSLYEIDMFLALAFQNVTEGDTPFCKTFTPFLGAQQDFSDCTLGTNAWAATICKRYPIAATSWMLTSCIADSIKLSAERGDYAKFECSLVSLEPAEMDATPSGTWERGLDGPGGDDARASAYGMKFFHDLSATTIAYNGEAADDLAVHSWSIEYNQEVSGEAPDGSGAFDNYGIINRGGTGEIVCLKDSVVEAALANWAANGYVQFITRWGAAGAAVNQEMQITANGVITDIKTDESGILGSTISFDLSAADITTDMLEIKLSNLIDRTWPAPA